MNSSTLIAVLLSVLGTAALTLIVPWVVKQSKAKIAAQKEFVAAMAQLTLVATELADAPKMIAGHAAAAGAMAVEVGKLREAVSQFANIVTKPAEPVEMAAREALSFASHTNEADADRAYRIAELWAQDPTKSPEAIARQAQDELDKISSMPSVSME